MSWTQVIGPAVIASIISALAEWFFRVRREQQNREVDRQRALADSIINQRIEVYQEYASTISKCGHELGEYARRGYVGFVEDELSHSEDALSLFEKEMTEAGFSLSKLQVVAGETVFGVAIQARSALGELRRAVEVDRPAYVMPTAANYAGSRWAAIWDPWKNARDQFGVSASTEVLSHYSVDAPTPSKSRLFRRKSSKRLSCFAPNA